MSDRSLLGAEFSTWANQRIGTVCPMCGAEIEYTPVGLADVQAQHRIECDCTVIESEPTGEVNG